MTAEVILAIVLRVNVVASVAILLVMLLRPVMLRWLGAKGAYSLWLVVPIVAFVSVLPARERIISPVAPPPVIAETEAVSDVIDAAPPAASEEIVRRVAPLQPPPALAELLLAVWLIGAAGLLIHSIVTTSRHARDPSVGPALIGVLRPRLILPADFEVRFDAQERALILAHEEVHRAAGHPLVNALVEAARCACWFNPLAHVAARWVRADQELACDAAVIAAHPAKRRTYAQALLKTQLARAFLPLGCTWPSRSGERLKERIAMLSKSSPGRWTAIAAAAVVGAVSAASSLAAWAQQEPRVEAPEAVWTASADAPEGMLTPREVTLHDLSIALAQAGGIDIVFFGRTNTEMFWWRDRGRPVWDRTLGLRKAANFGSQGTNPTSLLWRMQNGELDGYLAKVVVLEAFGNPAPQTADSSDNPDELVAAYTPILAEIRARQPQAKILIMATFPRGQMSQEHWRRLAGANAEAHADLVDHETVFYLDISDRFFLPDGAHNQQMWRYAPISGLSNVGIQAAGFEAWAEELEPWLEQFVD